MYPVYVCPILTVQAHILNSPQDPSTLYFTWGCTSKAKQAQTDLGSTNRFPTPSKLSSHAYIWRESKFLLCVWPTLQATAEKLCVPLGVVCYDVRGRNKMYSQLFQFRYNQLL